MFIVSGPELVLAQCKAGIMGAFPTLNTRLAAELAACRRAITRGEHILAAQAMGADHLGAGEVIAELTCD